MFLYQPDPPAMLELSDDLSRTEREIPLALPPACLLSNLYASPARDALLAELTCPDGPAAALVDLASGKLDMLIPDRSMDSHVLSWSSDSRSVYLRVASMTDPHIVRVDTTSLHQAEIPIDAYTFDISTAPDGGQILFSFSRGMGLGSELWSAKPGGSSPRRILSDAGNILAFARSSPAADQIACIKIPDTNVPFPVGELWLLEGAAGKKLADADAGHGYAPAWSPDGSRIAFVVRSNPEDARADQATEALVSNISVVDIPSGTVRQVTHFDQGRAGAPAWSPDGNTLAFAYVLDGRMEVQIADPTGDTASSMIAENACCPVWMRK